MAIDAIVHNIVWHVVLHIVPSHRKSMQIQSVPKWFKIIISISKLLGIPKLLLFQKNIPKL